MRYKNKTCSFHAQHFSITSYNAYTLSLLCFLVTYPISLLVKFFFFLRDSKKSFIIDIGISIISIKYMVCFVVS